MKIKQHYTKNYFVATPFYEELKKRMSYMAPFEYALVSVDLDNFNYINDLFGFEIGDRTLKTIADRISKLLGKQEIFGCINADKFAILLRLDKGNMDERLKTILSLNEDCADFLPYHYTLVFSGGIYPITDVEESISSMLDRADFVRKNAKGNHESTFLLYSKEMEDLQRWKKAITTGMDSALRNREFMMFLQPKVLIKTSEVIGAEALVRWSSPNGMIFPDQFIPVFEQNGFIKLLDFFMLEEACKFLIECKEKGLPVLPISINFSKVHVGTPLLAEKIFDTVNKYGLQASLIEIEMTESVFERDFEKLKEIALALKKMGFRISLDDFGEGYSSLGYLKDFPVDIVKIDKSFLNSTSNTVKGRLIIAKIIEMIKSMHIMTVMEGVEKAEQIEFLKKLNCDFGQGYFYSKPLPVAEYELYLKNNHTLQMPISFNLNTTDLTEDDYLDVVPKEFQMDNWEFFTLAQNIDIGLIKGVLGENTTIEYINKRALEYLGYTAKELRDVLHNNISSFTHPDDERTVKKGSKRMLETGRAMNFKIRAIRKDGNVIYLKGRASSVRDNQGRIVSLYAFRDVTDEEARKVLLNGLRNQKGSR